MPLRHPVPAAGNTWLVDATEVDSGQLLEVLRQTSGEPGLRGAAGPEPVTGGFWARIYSLRLEGGHRNTLRS